ncbi:MAG: 1,2-phenylacetyl-CoA epoxidase subunit B [Acidimicrobiia bacterium]|nr:1,2-phenylacetyl-CoA epoxidase subunit B [Acidimicrobiia bacterium]
MRTYEVFLRKSGRDPFSHAGSLDAPDDELAVLLAREAYVRRGEGDEMWVVDRADIRHADEALLGPNADKPHRHNDGSEVAEHRKAQRA